MKIQKKNNILGNNRGVISLIAFLSLGIFLLLGTYFLSLGLTETKITKSEEVSAKTYYLAESGINEAIWKLENDETARNNFLNGTLNEDDGIVRENVFGDNNARYSVSLASTARGEADIVATSTYQIGDGQSQRVVKAYVTKAIGSGSDWDFAMFSGIKGKEGKGEIKISGSGISMTVNGGRFHANRDIKLTGSEGSLAVNDGGITASGDIDVTGSGSEIILNNSYQEESTSTVDTAPLDFNEWAERATQTYTANQFKNLPSGTVLDGIIYVDNSVTLSDSSYSLTVNGILIIDGSLKLSGSEINLTVNYDSEYGGGLFVNDNLNVSSSDVNLILNGLIYISKSLKISGSNVDFSSTGTVIANDIGFSGSNIVMDLNYYPEYFQDSLDPAMNPDSPIIWISHWEEVY